MAEFVLIHGAMQGGWIWGAVAKQLQKSGHRVLHPSLDGAGERAPSLRPDITLASQGAEIARLIVFEDLQNIVLVGTSTGGMVAASAAQEVPERIGRLVFIDALVPAPGETVAEINRRAPRDVNDLAYGLQPNEVLEKAYPGVEPPALRAWAQARYTRQPRIPVDGPIDLEHFWALSWRADVMRCSRSSDPSEAHQLRTAERLKANYQVLDAGHYPMLTHPDVIANYLLGRH